MPRTEKRVRACGWGSPGEAGGSIASARPCRPRLAHALSGLHAHPKLYFLNPNPTTLIPETACARTRTQVDLLLGDPRKARAELGWDPHRTSLAELVREMVDADLEMARDPAAYLRY